jgi:phosphoglycerate dehydrogenase-like enzyme
LRASAPTLSGARVKFVETADELRTALPDCEILVTEGLHVTAQDIATAPKLKIIQKFGTITKNIDIEAARAAGVRVLTLRRRANIACAEHAFALMLALGRRLDRFSNTISENQLEALGLPYKPLIALTLPDQTGPVFRVFGC